MNILLFSEVAERPLDWWDRPQCLIVIHKYRFSWRCTIYSVLARTIAKTEEIFQASDINSLRTVLGYIITKFKTDAIFFQGSDWSPEAEALLISIFEDIEIIQCPLVLVPDCSEVESNDN